LNAERVTGKVWGKNKVRQTGHKLLPFCRQWGIESSSKTGESSVGEKPKTKTPNKHPTTTPPKKKTTQKTNRKNKTPPPNHT